MDIFNGIDHRVLNVGNEYEYNEIEYDSRKIKENDIFVALSGSVVDGHNYIEKAIKLGAKMILVSKDVEIVDESINYIKIDDLRHKLGKIASNYYNHPQNDLKIIGITGTNGKTTSTYILETILENITRVGTVEYKIGNEILKAPNTTPESLDLIKICKKTKEKGIKYLITEVSSHALIMGRVNMIKFDVCMFTNLTTDHMDFHKTQENYFNAKRKLFLKLKDKSNGVYNIEDLAGKRLYNEFGGITYGKNADISGIILKTGIEQEIQITYLNKNYKLKTTLLGRYNMMNILGSIGVALKLGFSIENIIKNLHKDIIIPGRFEVIKGKDVNVIVDYAHTGDGLQNVLKAINEIKIGKVITVFGCGGNKGKDKRWQMGEAACKLSDYTIISSDNPRTEPFLDIVKDIERGFIVENILRKDRYEVVKDREKAIKKAIEIADKNDIILLAGKGHETTQTVLNETFHFDDREMARKYIK